MVAHAHTHTQEIIGLVLPMFYHIRAYFLPHNLVSVEFVNIVCGSGSILYIVLPRNHCCRKKYWSNVFYSCVLYVHLLQYGAKKYLHSARVCYFCTIYILWHSVHSCTIQNGLSPLQSIELLSMPG